MAENEPEISILDQRLAEIDRRLSRIQVGLTEEVEGAERSLTLAPPLAVSGEHAVSGKLAERGAGEEPPRGDDGDDRDDSSLVTAELRGLVSDQARLLDRLAELVSVGERLLSSAVESPAGDSARSGSVQAPGPVAATPPAATAAGALTVTAGPFASLDAVRAFERTLATLPGVASAEVRGYEGGDRAVVDVHLSGATS